MPVAELRVGVPGHLVLLVLAAARWRIEAGDVRLEKGRDGAADEVRGHLP